MDLHEDGDALRRWFLANQLRLETAYLAGEQPWQQSGFGLHSLRPAAQWAALRQPVAECVTTSGSFLDIGCANGYLLECLLTWTARRGFTLTPFGLDFSAKLVELARLRLPSWAHQIAVGNAWDWVPSRPFDYVRTELVYVPEALRSEYIERLLALFLRPGGKLLIAEYRARTDSAPMLTIDRELRERGFAVEGVVSGCWEGIEQTRVAVIPSPLT